MKKNNDDPLSSAIRGLSNVHSFFLKMLMMIMMMLMIKRKTDMEIYMVQV